MSWSAIDHSINRDTPALQDNVHEVKHASETMNPQLETVATSSSDLLSHVITLQRSILKLEQCRQEHEQKLHKFIQQEKRDLKDLRENMDQLRQDQFAGIQTLPEPGLATLRTDFMKMLDERCNAQDSKLSKALEAVDQMHSNRDKLANEEVTAIDPVPVNATKEPSAILADAEDHAHLPYTINGSMWDVGIFFGLPDLGIVGSIDLAATMLLNIVVQCVFCGVCATAFSEPDLDDPGIFGLKVWRWNSAHDVRNINDIWPISLASSVCGSDASLPLSAQQTEQLGSVKMYRREQAKYVGELMCVLCLLCLWTILWQELREVIRFGRAALRAIGTRTSFVAAGDGSLELKSISPLRTVLVGVIFLLRLSIIGIIGWVGTRWLANTTSVGDLLLNAIALELILNVDELLFEGLVPARAKALVENCKPLPLWNFSRTSGGEFNSILGKVVIFAGLPVVYINFVWETADLVARAEAALCGGTTNFAFSEDLFGIVFIHDNMNTPSDTTFTEEGFDQGDLRILAMHEVMQGIPNTDWKYAFHEPDLRNLGSLRSTPLILRANQVNRNCEDLLVAEISKGNRPYLEALRHLTNDHNIDICPSVAPYCYGNVRSAALARSLCPVTCGCTSPTTGSFLTGPIAIDSAQYAGCAHNCEPLSMKEVPLDHSCNDSMVNGTIWQMWMSEAVGVLAPPQAIDLLRDRGCSALLGEDLRQMIDGETLCRQGLLGTKAIATVCPDACGCGKQQNAEDPNHWCPQSCRYGYTGNNNFAAVDQNGDGGITEDEVTDYLIAEFRKKYSRDPREEEGYMLNNYMKQLFDAADMNSDSRLDLTEFPVLTEAYDPNKVEAIPEGDLAFNNFQALDQNGDGWIIADELTDYLVAEFRKKTLRDPTEAEGYVLEDFMKQLLNASDSNSDSRIDFDEFPKLNEAYNTAPVQGNQEGNQEGNLTDHQGSVGNEPSVFEIVDLDRDGVITQAEFSYWLLREHIVERVQRETDRAPTDQELDAQLAPFQTFIQTMTSNVGGNGNGDDLNEDQDQETNSDGGASVSINCDDSCMWDCVDFPSDCTEFQEMISTGCARNCPLCHKGVLRHMFGCTFTGSGNGTENEGDD